MVIDRVTIADIQKKKHDGKKITMLTAYDYPMAKLVDEAGFDMILVGDSLGMVVLGYDSTLPVTMDDMIHHAKAARRGTKRALLVGDMPYRSYETADDAVQNAARFVKEGGCDAVKLEGGSAVIDQTKAIIRSGIPVMGHLGLTPQSADKLGGFKVQGKDAGKAKEILTDAKLLEEAGCFCVILECVPDRLAKLITGELKTPTIGIGAGVYCDGQVLVLNDLIGLFDRFIPKFVKRYANISKDISDGIKRFKEEVETGLFPDEEHSFKIKDEELNKLKKQYGNDK